MRSALVLFLFLSPCLWARDLLFTSSPEDHLVLDRGKGNLQIEFGYKESSKFYDAAGNLQNQFSGGERLSFKDFSTEFAGSYGLSHKLMLWLELPLIYRRESRIFNASGFGVGDLQMGARVLLAKLPSKTEIAFDLSGRFPSGETDIGFVDSTQGLNIALPIGMGVFGLRPSFLIQQNFTSKSFVRVFGSYTARFGDYVEYLTTGTTLVTDSQGNVFQIPFGNLRIDWGDELRTGIQVQGRIGKSISLGLESTYMYQFKTKIQQTNLITSGTSFDFVGSTASSARSEFVTVTPWLAFHTGSWRIKVGSDLESLFGDGIYGESYPSFLTQTFVQSMVGNKYFAELRYDF